MSSEESEERGFWRVRVIEFSELRLVIGQGVINLVLSYTVFMVLEARSSQQQDFDLIQNSLLAIQDSHGALTSNIEKLELNQKLDSLPQGTQNLNDSSSSRIEATKVNSILKGIKLIIPKFTRASVLG